MTTGNFENGRGRKNMLERIKEINCSRCPYHQKENWKRKARPSRYKAVGRESIRISGFDALAESDELES